MNLCPTCERDSLVFVTINGVVYCPACSPVPDNKPHDYKFPHEYQYATGGVVKLTDAQARQLSEPPVYIIPACDPVYALTIRTRAAINTDACCLDPGDCGQDCGQE